MKIKADDYKELVMIEARVELAREYVLAAKYPCIRELCRILQIELPKDDLREEPF